MVIGEQPHRVSLPPRWDGRRGHREWPCGFTDGGYMFGDGDDCRAADLHLEDMLGPPNYSSAWANGRAIRVESTHTETKVFQESVDGTMTSPMGGAQPLFK